MGYKIRNWDLGVGNNSWRMPEKLLSTEDNKNSFRKEDHPAKKDGEVWVNNCSSQEGFDALEWKSKRKDIPAFDVNGKELPTNYFAVFVDRAEFEAGK